MDYSKERPKIYIWLLSAQSLLIQSAEDDTRTRMVAPIIFLSWQEVLYNLPTLCSHCLGWYSFHVIAGLHSKCLLTLTWAELRPAHAVVLTHCRNQSWPNGRKKISRKEGGRKNKKKRRKEEEARTKEKGIREKRKSQNRWPGQTPLRKRDKIKKVNPQDFTRPSAEKEKQVGRVKLLSIQSRF